MKNMKFGRRQQLNVELSQKLNETWVFQNRTYGQRLVFTDCISQNVHQFEEKVEDIDRRLVCITLIDGSLYLSGLLIIFI